MELSEQLAVRENLSGRQNFLSAGQEKQTAGQVLRSYVTGRAVCPFVRVGTLWREPAGRRAVASV